MSSYDYVDKKEPRIGRQVYIESVHGDWFQYRASLLEAAQSKLSEEEKDTILRASVKVYGSLQKVSHQQNIPLLQHTLDQVKRATEYCTWIKRIAPIFLISDASAMLLNPDTFEINTTVALKLSSLRGVANFVRTKVANRFHQEFLDIDSQDSLSMLVRLRDYCIPSNPTIRKDLHKEMRYFRILPEEDGGQYIERFQGRMVHVRAHAIEFSKSEEIDILLEGFGRCTCPLHSRYQTQIATYRQMRGIEDRATVKTSNVLTFTLIREAIFAIDGLYQHSQKQRGEKRPSESRVNRTPSHQKARVQHDANQVRVAGAPKDPVKCLSALEPITSTNALRSPTPQRSRSIGTNTAPSKRTPRQHPLRSLVPRQLRRPASLPH